MPDHRPPRKTDEEPVYIGLTGTMASGKGEAAKVFKNLHFSFISLSDMVREEATKRGKNKISRQEMQNLGNELREKAGADVLARRVRQKIVASKRKKWVIDGIRNPAEVRELKKLGPFYLLGIKSDLEIILKRLQARKRETDRLKKSELEKLIDREWGSGESDNGQKVRACIRMSDFIIENNRGLPELKKRCLEILQRIRAKHG
jgi:dephospho-CoA kinase